MSLRPPTSIVPALTCNIGLQTQYDHDIAAESFDLGPHLSISPRVGEPPFRAACGEVAVIKSRLYVMHWYPQNQYIVNAEDTAPCETLLFSKRSHSFSKYAHLPVLNESSKYELYIEILALPGINAHFHD